MVAPHLLQSEFLHDAFIRAAEKLNGLVVERLLQQLNKSASSNFGSSLPVVAINRTQVSIILDIHNHPKGPNTPAKIAQRLNLEPSRISHQIKSLRQHGWIVNCAGTGKLPALTLSEDANDVALSARAVKQFLDRQLRKGHAKEFDTFLPKIEKKIASLLRAKPRRKRNPPGF